jgi:signal transduction histidine kinase
MKSQRAAVLLSLASHELRGPAGIVRGYLRLLLADPMLGERPRKSVADADRAADRLVGVLDDMNEYARFMRGQQKLDRRTRSLRSILNQAAQVAQPPLNPAIEIDVVAPADVHASVDETRLRAGLVAIIEAVCRAQTTASTVDITLDQAGTGRRKTAIIDIAPRSLRHGRRHSRPPDWSRSGLGLSVLIADAVMRAHGGRLVERWVSSEWAGYRISGIR